MDVKITINCDNSAFSDDPRAEVARILKTLVAILEYPGNLNEDTVITAHDYNGNNVGKLTVEE